MPRSPTSTYYSPTPKSSTGTLKISKDASRIRHAAQLNGMLTNAISTEPDAFQ